MNTYDKFLTGKVSIVTGAARGIGLEYAKALHLAGSRIVIADMRCTEECLALRNEFPDEVMIETIDVTKPETLDRTVGNVVEKWGRVDCLMNNAALYGDMIKKGWDEITFEEFEMMMDINITGTFNCIKAVFPVMKKQGAGNIINISTSLILFGPLNLSHYSCSKGGVVGLTRAMALELGQYGIRVNAIAPGLVQSQATNDLTSQAYIDLTLRLRCIKELVQPEGMTGAAVFLMSPASRAIVGQNIIVDGGVMFS